MDQLLSTRFLNSGFPAKSRWPDWPENGRHPESGQKSLAGLAGICLFITASRFGKAGGGLSPIKNKQYEQNLHHPHPYPASGYAFAQVDECCSELVELRGGEREKLNK